MFLLLFLVWSIYEAASCSRGCVASYNGMAYGYAWDTIDGHSCADGPQSSQTVYWAIVSPDYSGGGRHMLLDQGVIQDYTMSQMAC